MEQIKNGTAKAVLIALTVLFIVSAIFIVAMGAVTIKTLHGEFQSYDTAIEANAEFPEETSEDVVAESEIPKFFVTLRVIAALQLLLCTVVSAAYAAHCVAKHKDGIVIFLASGGCFGFFISFCYIAMAL
jgi:hypothetical protein